MTDAERLNQSVAETTRREFSPTFAERVIDLVAERVSDEAGHYGITKDDARRTARDRIDRMTMTEFLDVVSDALAS